MIAALALILQLAAPVVRSAPLPEKCVPRDTTITYPVIHYDSAYSLRDTRRTLIHNRNSYHYFIQRDGTVVKLMNPTCKADHAGMSYWDGHFLINSISIGICLQNVPPAPYTDKQYHSLAWLLQTLGKRWTLQDPVGHSQVAIPRGRKKDPGPEFRWGYLDTLLGRIKLP